MYIRFKKFLSMFLSITILLGTINMPSAVFAADNVDHVVISQVYGAGGNSGALYTHDYIELYNPTSSSIDLTNWSVQYASSTGSYWNPTTLTGTINAGDYYLIMQNGGTTGEALPTPNDTGSVSMSASKGKIALVLNSDPITGKNDADVVDFVGYGSANEFEGSAAVGSLSSTTAAIRKIGVDTDDNATDFNIAAPSPRAGTVSAEVKCTAPNASLSDDILLSGTTVMFETTTAGAIVEFNTVAADHDVWTVGSEVVVTEDITYYLRATKDGLETSDVVTITYTVDVSAPITIEAAKSLADDTTDINTKGVITYIYNNKVYIQDDSGAICVYLNASASTLQIGDEIQLIGKRASYKGLLKLENVNEGAVKVLSKDNSVTVNTATIAEINVTPDGKSVAFDTMCEMVEVKNAVLTDKSTLTQGLDTISIYPNIDLSDFDGIAFGDRVDVIAIVGAYNSAQLNILEITKIPDVPTPTYTDLLITEYIEGSSNNKAIEIYNGTDDVIDLSQYTLTLYSNGGNLPGNTTSLASPEKATLQPGELLVIGNSSAADAIKDVTTFASNVTYYNGNDALVLMKGTVVIDSFGNTTDATKYADEITYRRALTVLTGDTTIDDAFTADGWVEFAQDAMDDIGKYNGSAIGTEPGTDPTFNLNVDPAFNMAEYYSSANGLTGDALKTALNLIIDDHTALSYSEAYVALSLTDAAKGPVLKANYDSNVYGNIVTFYTGELMVGPNPSGLANGWNREHVWAKSHGDFGTSSGPGTDLHQLRPTDDEVNTRRGHLDFDESDVLYIAGNYVDSDSWEPRDEVKGDVARVLFYMATRYEGTEYLDLELSESLDSYSQTNEGYGEHGKLSTLLAWHIQDPVSDFEISRNNVIHQDYQGNRNPFIDHPEYVNKIFGDGTVNSDVPMTLKDALALPSDTANVTVQAQIAYFATSFGNPVLQAEVDGQVYSLYVFGAAPDGAKVGDTVKMTGTFSIYNGLPELTYILSSEIISTDTPLGALEMTVQEIKDNGLNNIGRFVKIKDVTLGEYNGSGSTIVTDSTGTINIYKATSYPALVEQGDVVDLYAMIACFNSSVQLYVGTKDDNGYNVYDVVNDSKNPLLTLNDNYLDAKVNTDYTITVAAADNKGIDTVKVSYVLGETTVLDQLMTYDETLAVYKFVVPAADIVSSLDHIDFTFIAKDVTGLTSTDSVTITVDNRPQITEVSPSRNSNLSNNNTPKISVTLKNAGIDPVVTVSMINGDTAVITDQLMTAKDANVIYEHTTNGLTDGIYTVTVTVTRADAVSNQIVWSFTVGTQQFKPYFGQLHAHTAEYSDGAGTLADGLNYLKSLPTSDNVDFISFTDHSNYFDSKDSPNPAEAMNDKTQMTAESLQKWNNYNSATDTFNTENAGALQALTAYEMTWSGGPGHINTFNSEGLVSRNNSTLDSKSADAGMKAYYDTLIQNADPLANLSQFNHPGKTFGSFSDFAYWSPAYDNKMVAIEVGNGEGAVGSGGYFTSYEEYTKALDKGWHVAPTNNQDNHKGKWGNSNTARTVIITDQMTKDGLLTGLKNMSVYTTEDKNLDIQYSVNNQIMGSIIGDIPTQPLQFIIRVNDPDSDDIVSKIEIISNGGRVVNSKTFNTLSADWSFELPSQQGYYYVRVTQADKNIAVTAPVWIGQAPLVGISSFETTTKLPVTDETLDFTTTLFNNEAAPVTVKTIEYKLGDEVLKTDTLNQEIASSGTMNNSFSYTPTVSKDIMLTATAIIDVGGQEKSFEQKLQLYVRDASKLTYVGIDASHYNEYVNGNYKDSMGNFANMAVQSDVRVVELTTAEDFMAATQDDKYKMIILTPPTRRNGNSFLIGYKSYTDEEIAAVKAFAEKGNTVIVTGWGDYYESYDKYSDNTPHVLPIDQHMSAQQNKLLEALGSNIRISDDEVKDDTNNGGQPQRLYLSEYNLENEFVKNVLANEQVFSNYGGATVYTIDSEGQPSGTIPTTVSPMVYSFVTSYSADDDKDGTTGIEGILVPKYTDKYMIAASEKVDYENGKVGTIIVSGAAFMSNFEIQAALDSYATPEYSNYTILDEIVKSINVVEITDIADLHDAEEGVRFVIEGTVTSNASGFDKDTAFFDSIYLQDATAGINAFPVSGDIRAGQKVRIKGVTSSYNGERQISVISIETIDATINTLPEPLLLTIAQAAAGQELGSIVKVSGTVTRIEKSNNVVESIFVQVGSGEECRVFIDGYITKDKTIANLVVGSNITAVGMSSISTEGPRIRVRDRDDVICTVNQNDNTSNSSKNVKVIRVSLNETELELEVGTDAVDTTFDLNAIVSGTSSKTIVWSSSAEDIATVDKNGLVTAIAVGTATITASRKSGTEKATATVEVFLVGDEQNPLGAVTFKAPYMTGFEDGTFRPNTAVTRGQLAVIYSKILGLNITADTDQKFTDVDKNHWSYNYVQAVARTGIFSGYEDGSFKPNQALTRGELAATFSKYWEFKNIDVTTDEVNDVLDISNHWASSHIYRMYNANVLDSNMIKFEPNAQALRGQVVQMINTLIGRSSLEVDQSKFPDVFDNDIMGAIEAATSTTVELND